MAKKVAKKAAVRKAASKKPRKAAAEHESAAPQKDLDQLQASSHLLTRSQTDKGKKEIDQKRRRAGTLAKGRVRVTSGPYEKMMRHRQDAAEGKVPPEGAPDPMGEIIAEHRYPGMAQRFLSTERVKKRGMRGWVPIVTEQGDPVALGDLILCEKPIVNRDAQRKQNQDESRDLVRTIEESLEDKHEKVARDRDDTNVGPRRRGERATDREGRSSRDIGVKIQQQGEEVHQTVE